jgi:MFS family permease
MHADLPSPPPGVDEFSRPWTSYLTGYHWFVLIVASLGWLFDTMDQRIFLVSREAALTDLLGFRHGEGGRLHRADGSTLTENETGEARLEIRRFGGYATTIFMLGWATGGLFFGVMGDRWGRARTMLITIVVYSMFTGLSAISQHWWDFMFYRFLTGLGVGGEFAAGVALVAEVMPAPARRQALGLLQALSAVGNIAGSLVSWVVLPFGWQWMFLVGTVPAVMVIFVMRYLREPDSWVKARVAPVAINPKNHEEAIFVKGPGPQSTAQEAVTQELGSLKSLLGVRRWRRNALVGFVLALAGVIGLWGVAFWSFELVNEALRGHPREEVIGIRAVGTALQDVGAFFGILAFTFVAGRLGRRPAFAVSFLIALASIFLVFGFMRTALDVYWMLPILGFCTLSVFGGYAIYFPELFPTRLRSTGTGFCYNAARFIAAVGPFFLTGLDGYFADVRPAVLSGFGGVDSSFRYAALSVASIYVLGLLVLPFAPETKGRPLPE